MQIIYVYIYDKANDEWINIYYIYDQVTISLMPWQFSCHGMCKVITWFEHETKNYQKNNIYKILIISS